jgi:hypothetical protein
MGSTLRFRNIGERTMTEQTTTSKYAKDKLGHIPQEKIASVVGTKLWAEHQKLSEALTQARDAASVSKEQVRKAIQKSLKINEPIDFSFDHSGKLVIFRPKEQKARPSKSVDLTAS